MLLIRILRETAPSTAHVIERNRHFQHCDKLTSCFPQNQFGWIGPSAPHRFKPSPKSHPHVPFPPIRYNRTFMLRYFTAGESHGEALVAFLSGLPAGLKVDQVFVDRELWRRQQGYGRGGRMKIERDTAHILSGVRHGLTIGSPIAILLENKDWKNWQEALPVETGDPAKHKRVASPRPGHADLAGALKYNSREARYVLERASARESASL